MNARYDQSRETGLIDDDDIVLALDGGSTVTLRSLGAWLGHATKRTTNSKCDITQTMNRFDQPQIRRTDQRMMKSP